MKSKSMSGTYLRVIEWTLADGADADLEMNGAPVLYWVAKGGNAGAAKILLDAGADPDANYTRESEDREESAYEATTSTEVKMLLENAGARY